MFDGFAIATYLFAWGAMPLVLWWAYRVTRRPAVIVYGAWFLLGHFLFPVGEKLLINHYLRSGSSWLIANTAGTLAAEMSMLTTMVGTALFIWLLVSLVRWGEPVIGSPWWSPRVPTMPVADG
jgi:hypothetical protein